MPRSLVKEEPTDTSPDGAHMQLLPAAATQQLSLTQDNAVTSLWAGFGTLYRIPRPSTGPATSSVRRSRSNRHDAAATTLVVKHIHLSAADVAGASSSASDLRKVHSYLAETAFYVHLAPTLAPADPDDPNTVAPVPLAHLDQPLSYMHRHAESGLYTDLVLVLSDLSPAFPIDGDYLSPFSLPHTRAVLHWLARFHGHFWHSPMLDTTPHLWAPTGSYWHLATRPGELARARRQRGDPWAWIVEGAEYWDALLSVSAVDQKDKCGSRQGSRWARQTLVHGDAKAANALFAKPTSGEQDGSKCAMVDFQYVGPGCGMRDVAYLVATSVDVDQVYGGDHVKMIELGYWPELAQTLRGKSQEVPSVQECVDMFEVALLDWCRFMCGWGRWGNIKWVGKVVDAIRTKWEQRRKIAWQPSDAAYAQGTA